jgi:RNA polymerase sigma factor (sigma-70 family)
MDDEYSQIPALVAAAVQGDQAAWDEIVDRYSPLLVRVIHRFRLTASETEDVAQTVWLRLVEHLDELREARALPMWIITTGKRESVRHLSLERRSQPHDPAGVNWPDCPAGDIPPGEELIQAERHQALLAGLAELSGRHRQLLLLLMEDPPLPYAEISRRTGIPVGGIGPTRARAIERLRRTAPIRNWTADPKQFDRAGR